MKRSLTPVFLLALLAAILTACTNTSRIIATGLEIELTGIERASDGTVTAAWHVKNPNIVSYLFSRVSHKIQLNGTYLGLIEETEPLPVPATSNDAGRTSKLTKVDAAANRVLTEAASAGSASYRVDTQITILIYDDTVEKSSLTNSGTVPVKAK
jgi:hypothetical protein